MAANKRLPNLMLEDVRIMFRNFAGNPTKFDPIGGKRTFAVALEDQAIAEALLNDGWNVKFLKPRDEDEQPLPYLQVKVRLDGDRPANVVMITSRGRTTLDESTAALLDYADIATIDMILNPFNWDVNGKQGVTAYLKSIYVTILEDELTLKYADIREISGNETRELTMSEQTLQITDGSEGQYVEFEEA